MSDLDLLRQCSQKGSEEAFATLVNRHLNLVYATALRRVRSPQLAEEVTQSVFLSLARNSNAMKPDTVLAAWLYRVTRHTAIDLLRGESRRHLREQTAFELGNMKSDSAEWAQVEPLLDEALETLDETDRSAILLRYFENKSLREVGATLGTSEDAAQKRVSRAVEHLRGCFSKRGVAVSATSLIAGFGAQATQAAPAGLSASITAATALAAPAVQVAATATAAKAIAMTTLQKALITGTIVAVGAGIYEARQASALQTRAQNLEQQQAPLAAQVRQLTGDREEARGQLAALRDENERLSRDTADLLRIRGELALLRADSQELARLKAAAKQPAKQPADNGDELTAELWLSRADTFKKWIEAHPEEQIPEFQYLRHAVWLDVVKDTNLKGDYAPLHAASRLRQRAKEEFASEISNALRRFVADNTGNLPPDLYQLNSYLSRPMTEDLINSYKLLYSGKIADVPKGEWLVIETRRQEDPGHTHFAIGTNMWATIR